MSAPAGWHLQPDGQERYWDGTQWTEQFRAPLPSDPTAPPPLPSWSDPADETQAVDVNSTQAIPAAPAQPAYPTTAYQQPGYEQPGYPQPGYQQPGYPQTGYGAPGNLPYTPPPKQGNAVAKGCLIAALLGVLVLGAGIVGAVFVFNRAADTISDTFPSGFPTRLPSDFPSDLSTDGLGQDIDISVGDGFELSRATIESGWVLEAQQGASVVTITGMKATLTSDDGFPVLFTMSFADPGGDKVETVCTATGSSGDTVDVSCLPLVGDVADATQATVTASL